MPRIITWNIPVPDSILACLGMFIFQVRLYTYFKQMSLTCPSATLFFLHLFVSFRLLTSSFSLHSCHRPVPMAPLLRQTGNKCICRIAQLQDEMLPLKSERCKGHTILLLSFDDDLWIVSRCGLPRTIPVGPFIFVENIIYNCVSCVNDKPLSGTWLTPFLFFVPDKRILQSAKLNKILNKTIKLL